MISPQAQFESEPQWPMMEDSMTQRERVDYEGWLDSLWFELRAMEVEQGEDF
jgi:hypothetical protein